MAAHAHPLKPQDRVDPVETLASEEAHHHHVHVTPFWTMFWVFVILLILTGLTVWSSNIHGFWFGNTHIEFSGTAHILLAMTIAVVKAVLVGAFFMHLLYDKKVNTIVMASTIFALGLFIGLTLLDMSTRDNANRIESGEIHAGGIVSKYKGNLRKSAQGFAGNIVESAQAEAAAAHGNPDGDAHAPEAPSDPAPPPADVPADPAATPGDH
jgi:cytochrome c oxidase subunit 4